jgi:hypothetical protein
MAEFSYETKFALSLQRKDTRIKLTSRVSAIQDIRRRIGPACSCDQVAEWLDEEIDALRNLADSLSG